MPGILFLKRNAVLWIVGVISALVATRLEPFKSHMPLAITVGFAVGLMASVIEVAIRKLANQFKRATDSPPAGYGER